MAQSENNDLTLGLRGRFGKMFSFRQFYGKTIAARRPPKRQGPGTENQELVKEQFKEATVYAKGVISDPDQKELYSDLSHTGVSSYNRAMADFIQAPKIVRIDKSNYTGAATDTVIVRATDDFKVSHVRVSIDDPNGNLVEEGEAVLQSNGADWLYSVTGENETATGSKIKATAYDLAGNQSLLEVTV